MVLCAYGIYFDVPRTEINSPPLNMMGTLFHRGDNL